MDPYYYTNSQHRRKTQKHNKTPSKEQKDLQTTSPTMTKSEPIATSVGSGMSRAAKKRAKKKNKKSTERQKKKAETEIAVEKKTDAKKKRPLMDRPDAKNSNGEAGPPPKQARKTSKQTLVEPPERNVDDMIQSILSKLSPLKILQLADLNDEEQVVTIQQEELSVSDLLKEATTQQRARALFQSLLGPTISLHEFYDKYWEQQPLYISASGDEASRLDGILSEDAIRELLETHPTYYGRDLNITRYEEGTDGVKRRVTLDPQPDDSDDEDVVLVDAKDVWENYKSGCSLRLLCPHKHNDVVHALLSTLEWEWGCMVGANVYLTPPRASQGFAPHYDDIEAFCLQLEGYKHWKVYAPLNRAQVLARQSSLDYVEEDLKGAVEPVLDVVLGPGDLLYMPRGWIHQACTTDSKEHSLHLTVSAMQHWAWADFLELLMPEALEAAAASATSTSLREGLPLRFLDYMGAVYDDANEKDLPEGLRKPMDASNEESGGYDYDDGDSDEKTHRARQIKMLREEFREEAKKRIMRVSKEVRSIESIRLPLILKGMFLTIIVSSVYYQALSMLDAACDQIGKRFISDRLPPALTAVEAEKTSESQSGAKLWPNTLVRLVRPGIARLALEDGKAVLYHCVDNSRVYQGNPLSPLEFELDDAPALELLLTTVEPHWIQVQDLIHDDIEDKMEIAQSLYDEGILAILQTEKPDKSVQVG